MGVVRYLVLEAAQVYDTWKWLSGLKYRHQYTSIDYIYQHPHNISGCVPCGTSKRVCYLEHLGTHWHAVALPLVQPTAQRMYLCRFSWISQSEHQQHVEPWFLPHLPPVCISNDLKLQYLACRTPCVLHIKNLIAGGHAYCTWTFNKCTHPKWPILSTVLL